MALRVGAAAVSSGATTTSAASWAAVTEHSSSNNNGRTASSLRIGCSMRPTFSSRMQPISASWGAFSDRRELVVASASGRKGAGSRGVRGEVRGNASAELASGGGDDAGGRGLAGYGGGDGEGAGDDSGKNREEALMVVTALGKTLENLPADLASAIQDGRITADIVKKYFSLEGSGFLGWLMKFGGFKERLLADDLFLTKVGIECGVGIFTKTAAELEKRKENFSKELDFVLADVVMALIADFMLVWLPAPTVSLRPKLATGAGKIANFFYNCPDNAFQVALRGQSYSLLQRLGAIARNGGKLLAVGTTASLVGTATTNSLVAVRRKMDKNFEGETEDIPILQTSLAYGVYMAVSSNLRYQILAGVIEQRILEPMLHNQKLLLGVMSFGVRTGNTFLGSLMWVDYARWVGVQKDRGTVEGADGVAPGVAPA